MTLLKQSSFTYGIALAACLLLLAQPVAAQDLSISLADDGSLTTRSIQLLVLITVLSLVPGIAMMVTCFPFMVTVLAILRQAIGLQQSPPNMLMISIALFLTYFVMEPVFLASWNAGISPLLEGVIEIEVAFDRAIPPLRTFCPFSLLIWLLLLF